MTVERITQLSRRWKKRVQLPTFERRDVAIWTSWRGQTVKKRVQLPTSKTSPLEAVRDAKQHAVQVAVVTGCVRPALEYTTNIVFRAA